MQNCSQLYYNCTALNSCLLQCKSVWNVRFCPLSYVVYPAPIFELCCTGSWHSFMTGVVRTELLGFIANLIWICKQMIVTFFSGLANDVLSMLWKCVSYTTKWQNCPGIGFALNLKDSLYWFQQLCGIKWVHLVSFYNLFWKKGVYLL